MKKVALRSTTMALPAAAALLLGPAVAAVPASADDGPAIGVGIQPLGVVEGPDGTLYVSDYDWAGGISAEMVPGRERPHIPACHSAASRSPARHPWESAAARITADTLA
jgi:hypothetical protein